MHRVIHQNGEFLLLDIDVPRHTQQMIYSRQINSPLTEGK
jgi:hypothetical protein